MIYSFCTAYCKKLFGKNTKVFFSIHNLAYFSLTWASDYRKNFATFVLNTYSKCPFKHQQTYIFGILVFLAWNDLEIVDDAFLENILQNSIFCIQHSIQFNWRSLLIAFIAKLEYFAMLVQKSIKWQLNIGVKLNFNSYFFNTNLSVNLNVFYSIKFSTKKKYFVFLTVKIVMIFILNVNNKAKYGFQKHKKEIMVQSQKSWMLYFNIFCIIYYYPHIKPNQWK